MLTILEIKEYKIMATKMIGFRLSGDHLEQAQKILGDISNINKKAQELMIAFLNGKISITESNPEPVETLTPQPDLMDKIRQLEDQINQINQETINRLNDLENKIITANTANRLNIVPIEANQGTIDSNIDSTANTANSENTKVINHTANTANTEKYYRQKLLEQLNLSSKSSKIQIIPKLKKLGLIVDPNSENFYQESLNLLNQIKTAPANT